MKTFSACFCVFFAAAAAHASIVTISNLEDGRYLTSSSGNALANGSLVWVGTFANESAISAGMSVEQVQELGGWQWFGDSKTITVGGQSGKLGDDVRNDTTDALSFGGKTIFIWVLNQPTDSGVTEFGIFTARGGDDPWVFATNGIGSHTTIRIDNSSLEAVLGTIDGRRLMLAAVPEPATFGALLAMGALGYVAARRRSKRAA